jgi:hypothetical protein
MFAKSFKKIIQSFIHFTVKHNQHQQYDEVTKILALDMSGIGFPLKTIPTDSESSGLQRQEKIM